MVIRPIAIAPPWPQPTAALAAPRHNPFTMLGFIRAMVVLGFLLLLLQSQ
jgi:hypothetical protein